MMRPPKIHTLKTWPEYYKAVVEGRKKFEIRKNDRDFQVGDCLVLQEFDPGLDRYTSEMRAFKVTYILEGEPFLARDMVCMSIEKLYE
jgi:ribosomal protein S17